MNISSHMSFLLEYDDQSKEAYTEKLYKYTVNQKQTARQKLLGTFTFT